MSKSTGITIVAIVFALFIGYMLVTNNPIQTAGEVMVERAAEAAEPMVGADVEEAIRAINEGDGIILLGLELFKNDPSRELGAALLQAVDQWNYILGALCTIPGTEEACVSATATVAAAYDALIEYAKTLPEANPE